MPGPKPTIRLHLWIETEKGVFFGVGRAQLLQKVDECGSLKKAADELGMSYRAAWGKIKKTEEAMGERLIEQCGCRKDGYRLTEFGMFIKDNYLLWYSQVEEEALKKARDLFPWPVRSYEDTNPP
ncbi:MAG: LysR family transcriptional regulator [Syntrophobacteraceae bacterium]|nr:LysR family transcriptional regulator [Syntrophobacteraceae bacterium]